MNNSNIKVIDQLTLSLFYALIRKQEKKIYNINPRQLG